MDLLKELVKSRVGRPSLRIRMETKTNRTKGRKWYAGGGSRKVAVEIWTGPVQEGATIVGPKAK